MDQKILTLLFAILGYILIIKSNIVLEKKGGDEKRGIVLYVFGASFICIAVLNSLRLLLSF